jgi:hypothetical protein
VACGLEREGQHPLHNDRNNQLNIVKIIILLSRREGIK